jgi:membrane protease YdiL (CAAX protease family)
MKNPKYNLTFWQSRQGKLLQIFIVVVPSAACLWNAYLLLIGLTVSVLSATLMIRLRGSGWKSLGLCRPENWGLLFAKVLIGLVVLIPLSFIFRVWLTNLLNVAPDLQKFDVIHGNIIALILGLLVAWIFGALFEELFFRGFILNSLYELLPEKIDKRIKWILALTVTAVFTGIGHAYQGVTGMLTAGFIAVGFGIIYLCNKRNLWTSILAHGLYDSFAMMLVFAGIQSG